MIKAIIFDCFGVLYRDRKELLYELVPLEKMQDLRDIVSANDHGFISREDYYVKIAELTGKTIEDIRKVEGLEHIRDENMIAYTQTFKPEYKVGMLSNIDVDTMQRLFPEPDRSRLFDVFVMSGEVGVAKPMPEIFELAAEQLGLDPEECVMIDDLPVNIEGAQLAGMHGLVFSSQRQLVADLDQLLGRSDA